MLCDFKSSDYEKDNSKYILFNFILNPNILTSWESLQIRYYNKKFDTIPIELKNLIIH